jgi:hypothetical protein
MDEEDLGNDKDDDAVGPSGALAPETSNMEVDTSAPTSSASHGKSVSVSHVLFPVITPYNASPRTPRGREIVDRIRRVSPQLVGRPVVSQFALDVVPSDSQADMQGALEMSSSPPRPTEALQVQLEERGLLRRRRPPPSLVRLCWRGRKVPSRLPLQVGWRWLRRLLLRLCPLPRPRMLRRSGWCRWCMEEARWRWSVGLLHRPFLTPPRFRRRLWEGRPWVRLLQWHGQPRPPTYFYLDTCFTDGVTVAGSFTFPAIYAYERSATAHTCTVD